MWWSQSSNHQPSPISAGFLLAWPHTASPSLRRIILAKWLGFKSCGVHRDQREISTSSPVHPATSFPKILLLSRHKQSLIDDWVSYANQSHEEISIPLGSTMDMGYDLTHCDDKPNKDLSEMAKWGIARYGLLRLAGFTTRSSAWRECTAHKTRPYTTSLQYYCYMVEKTSKNHLLGWTSH